MGIFSVFKKEEILYYPGCRTYIKHPQSYALYKKILVKMGVNIITLDKNFCCGLLPLELGYEQEARKLARNNMEFLRENKIKNIITNCPSCYKMLLHDYPLILPDWDLEIKNIWKVILESLLKKPGLIKKKVYEEVTFHDSCYLGRYCGVYDTPRQILELLGYTIKEMPDCKENSMCAGSCGGLPFTNEKLADKIASQRIRQAKRLRVKKMIVTSFDNYDLLNKNSEGIEIIEMSKVLADALAIDLDEEEFSKEKSSEEKEELIDLEENKESREEKSLKDNEEEII